MYWRDWSSDVCSSDLPSVLHDARIARVRPGTGGVERFARSEERRVGKEGRYRWATYLEIDKSLMNKCNTVVHDAQYSFIFTLIVYSDYASIVSRMECT